MNKFAVFFSSLPQLHKDHWYVKFLKRFSNGCAKFSSYTEDKDIKYMIFAAICNFAYFMTVVINSLIYFGFSGIFLILTFICLHTLYGLYARYIDAKYISTLKSYTEYWSCRTHYYEKTHLKGMIIGSITGYYMWSHFSFFIFTLLGFDSKLLNQDLDMNGDNSHPDSFAKMIKTILED